MEKYSTNKKSVNGIIWQQKFYNERLKTAIYQRHDLAQNLSALLAGKQIALDEIENFLEPKIKTSLPNPFDLLDMRVAVDHVIAAIKAGKKITLFADYDVDGATSSALLKRFFAEIDVAVEIYIPDRILEGYGPNKEALINLKKNGSDLVITLDCGTVSFAPLEAAKAVGLDIIVIDHHLGVTEKPSAIAVINPNRIDETFPHKNLCAAGVTFLFCVAINQALRQINYYQEKKISEPKLMSLLDLVALGTVCDVMSLTGLNRAFVASGLKILKSRNNLGIRTICDLANLNEAPTAHHLGFVIGPRINAGGRLGTSNLGAKLLSTNNEFEAKEIAQQLEELNKKRKQTESEVLQEAIKRLNEGADGFSTNDAVIFAVAQGWHPGVIGIVASRLKDLYNKPVAVIALDGNKGKASCRSISGIDFGAEILKARLANILAEGGGHAMAGGFSIESSKIKKLHDFFCANLKEQVASLGNNKEKEFDLALDLAQVNIEFLKELQQLEPFGMGNVRPKFLIRNLRKIKAQIIGQTQEHISCIFSSKSAVGFDSQLQAVAFRAIDKSIALEQNPLAILLRDNFSKSFDVIGTLNINSWMGMEKVQFLLEDVVIS